MCSYGAHAIFKAYQLSRVADVAGALTLDALRGTDRAYDARLHSLRPYTGQQASAKLLKELLAGSEIRESHRVGDTHVQDAYSLRCMPQVHGASRDTIDHVLKIISIEINSANDNPLIFPDEEEHLEGGNFHGQPLALALDFLTIACAEFASISERRTERMVNGALSNGLPRFLTMRGGVQSGMMIAQYTSASIVSENKVLSHPASVDSIPTSANQEDHNSMGSISAQKCWKVVNNLQTVLAIELLCAAQAIDFLRPLKSSPRLEAVHAAIRTRVPFAEIDRVLFDDIQDVRDLIESGEILKAADLS
jgi:histidine ammonia-lyase